MGSGTNPVSYLEDLYQFLERKYEQYNRPEFIAKDPISIPHRFTNKQDREIMGFWSAMLAWGWRPTILKKADELVDLMGGEPYRFVTEHTSGDLKPFIKFKHRTFNATDTLYFFDFFKRYYRENNSLEEAFLEPYSGKAQEDIGFEKKGRFDIYLGLEKFNTIFFAGEHQQRTRKHVSRPSTGSTCKRLNMFLRWMVRNDGRGVDFGIWKDIDPSSLVIPLDLHVERVARNLGLIERKQCDWKTVKELTGRLAEFDPCDPVKYDFALFSLGTEELF